MLSILFRPSGRFVRSVPSFIDVDMTRLTISEAQSRDGTIVVVNIDDDLDWDRLRNPNDSYASILVDSDREFNPNFDRFD